MFNDKNKHIDLKLMGLVDMKMKTFFEKGNNVKNPSCSCSTRRCKRKNGFLYVMPMM
jgi:hypothetical protein